MQINIKVKLFASEAKIEKVDDNYFAYVTEKPEKGKANRQIIKLLSEYFSTPKQNITLKQGFSSRNKVFELKT